MIRHANLMPEAELALRRTRSVFTCVCKLCEEKTCGDCIVHIANESVKNCLAKLEGGDVHVPDTSGS